MRKVARYRKCGAREVWILDPENRVAFVESEDGNAILHDDDMFELKLISGFSMRLADLFDHE